MARMRGGGVGLASKFVQVLWGRLAAERDRWPLWLPVALGVGCVVKSKLLIAASLKPEALLEDCARAQILVSTAVAANCKGPAVVIDRKMAGEGWRITLSSPPTAVSVRDWRGERPWVAMASPSP